jgi:hypothetical protein
MNQSRQIAFLLAIALLVSVLGGPHPASAADPPALDPINLYQGIQLKPEWGEHGPSISIDGEALFLLSRERPGGDLFTVKPEHVATRFGATRWQPVVWVGLKPEGVHPLYEKGDADDVDRPDYITIALSLNFDYWGRVYVGDQARFESGDATGWATIPSGKRFFTFAPELRIRQGDFQVTDGNGQKSLQRVKQTIGGLSVATDIPILGSGDRGGHLTGTLSAYWVRDASPSPAALPDDIKENQAQVKVQLGYALSKRVGIEIDARYSRPYSGNGSDNKPYVDASLFYLLRKQGENEVKVAVRYRTGEDLGFEYPDNQVLASMLFDFFRLRKDGD